MSDRDGRIEPLSINTIPGKTMPRWDAETTELTALNVTITEQAMQSGLPAVDFVFEDPDGKRFAFTTSGRMMQMIAAAIAGVNTRIHGKPNP